MPESGDLVGYDQVMLGVDGSLDVLRRPCHNIGTGMSAGAQ
jgi:hypothetical protein